MMTPEILGKLDPTNDTIAVRVATAIPVRARKLEPNTQPGSDAQRVKGKTVPTTVARLIQALNQGKLQTESHELPF